ncbi:hypothetical protein SNE40_019943 [Patella caerulea]|uniref:PH domain-containing protein n=1 Tax=Patella caerulea TaxID=87958 RepID=A0AAN8GHB2_PATCE
MITSRREGTDGNDTDNDVFRSGSESPQYTLPVNTDPKQRRATVSGGSPTLDRPSLVIEDLDPPTRPKSQAVNAAERDAALAALTTAESNLTNLAGHRKISRMRSNELPQTKSSLTVPDQFQIRPDATSLEPFEDSIDEDKTPIMNSENIQIRGEKDKRHGFRVTKPTPIVIDLPDTEHIQRLSKQSVLDCELADAILPKDQPQLLKMKKIDPSSNVNSDEVKKDPQTKRVEFSSDTKDEGKEVQGPISYTHLIIGGVVQKIPSDQTQNYTCTESPTVRLRNKTPGKRLADRRISCKDLGKGDCEGWLYKRKTKDRGPLTKNWVKRWCVSKTNNLYYFKEKDDLKAEGVIHLLAFQVSPATDIKTKKFAFKVHNAGTTFYFASERQEDMSKWMNKMGLAAINYDTSNIMTTGGFIKPEPIVKAQGYGVQNVYYSESEDDDDNELGTSSTVSGSCLSLASATSKDSIATLTPTSVQNSPEKYSINKADEGRDDLAVMIRNIRKSELTIDGVDRNKTRRSQIQSSDLLTAAPSAELDKLRKLKSLHRTLKAKEHDLNEIETFLKDPVTPDKLHQFQDQHKELLPRRRSQKQRSSKNKHH